MIAHSAQIVPEERDDRPLLLQVSGLALEASMGGRVEAIVSSVDLTVHAGETIGIVGESGSGKSLTARAIGRLLPPGVVAHGEVLFGERDLLGLSERDASRIRGREVAVLFQDPFTMLNPVVTCGEQITDGLAKHRGQRIGKRERRAEAIARLDEVGIQDPSVADRYPFQLSGGMRQRVAIAAVLAADPKLLVADEPSTALDVTTQKEILDLLSTLQRSRQMAVVLITHDLRVAFTACERIYVLYAGRVVESGPSTKLEREPLHPYTLGLLLSEPPADRRLSELPSIKGSVPRAQEVVGTCPFVERCDWAASECKANTPPLRAVAPGRSSACVRLQSIRPELATARARREASVETPLNRNDGPPLVSVAQLEKVFVTRHGRQVTALGGVSLEVGVNESVGLVGESGSGKTTMARCLVGLEQPTAGSMTIDGIRADREASSQADQRKLRQAVQMIFQDPYSSLNPTRTVGSTLREAITVRPDQRENADSLLDNLLRRVGLPPDYAQRKPVALSGGERQRVAIARALAVRPKIIVCDEPVSALDVSVQAQILNVLKALRREIAVSYLFISHDLAVVRQVVEYVYVLLEGQIVEAGPVDRVLARPTHQYTRRLVESIPRSPGAVVGSPHLPTVDSPSAK